MINPHADRPAYLQVADVLRERIRSGELADGQLLPAEARMAYDFGVALITMRAALRRLREEGLIVTKAPYGTRVRGPRERRTVKVPRGSSAEFVFALTPADRERYGLDEGVPAAVLLTHPSGRVEAFPADEVRLSFS